GGGVGCGWCGEEAAESGVMRGSSTGADSFAPSQRPSGARQASFDMARERITRRATVRLTEAAKERTVPFVTHPDDRFHPPSSDDPYWTETCWFTFAVPERRLSGQLYPFFRPNQRVAAGGAYFWDESGSSVSSCRYAKNFW